MAVVTSQSATSKGLFGGEVRVSTVCLLMVGMGDLITSLMWLHAGYGEGNPLFAWLASQGSIWFALGKVIFLAGPILVLEYARQVRPRSAELGTWLATLLYMFLLFAHIQRQFGGQL
ncbi:MAG TPA: DUF5658 family protein [Fimbriimonadaceae bacterium]|nr:DUF5658 family protein [Fimbriimonadaceae bacterium]